MSIYNIIEEEYNHKTINTCMKTLRNYHGGQAKTTDAYNAYLIHIYIIIRLYLCRMSVKIIQMLLFSCPVNKDTKTYHDSLEFVRNLFSMFLLRQRLMTLNGFQLHHPCAEVVEL